MNFEVKQAAGHPSCAAAEARLTSRPCSTPAQDMSCMSQRCGVGVELAPCVIAIKAFFWEP